MRTSTINTALHTGVDQFNAVNRGTAAAVLGGEDPFDHGRMALAVTAQLLLQLLRQQSTPEEYGDLLLLADDVVKNCIEVTRVIATTSTRTENA